MSEAERPAGRDRYDLRNLVAPANLPRMAAIGAVVAAAAGAFAFTAGWLSPGRLTQDRIVDQFERTNGLHPGFRRNHPKGVCFTGWFDSDGAGQRLSKAALFRPGRAWAFGRFAIAGGQPTQPDSPTSVHSLAVNFKARNGEVWRMGMNGIPVFVVATVQDFYDQLAAATPDPKTGKPDPARLKAFVASHPQTARAMALIKAQPLASGFADTTYNSLDAFLFVDAQGRVTPVRWGMVPEDAFKAADPAAASSTDADFKFDELAARVRQGPVRWRMVAVIGQPGDTTRDPTTPWPADRERVQLGVLTVAALQDEALGPCRDVTFDPLVLPAGVKASDDPILSARSAAYASSFVRRAGEPTPQPPVRLPAAGGATR